MADLRQVRASARHQPVQRTTSFEKHPPKVCHRGMLAHSAGQGLDSAADKPGAIGLAPSADGLYARRTAKPRFVNRTGVWLLPGEDYQPAPMVLVRIRHR